VPTKKGGTKNTKKQDEKKSIAPPIVRSQKKRHFSGNGGTAPKQEPNVNIEEPRMRDSRVTEKKKNSKRREGEGRQRRQVKGELTWTGEGVPGGFLNE